MVRPATALKSPQSNLESRRRILKVNRRSFFIIGLVTLFGLGGLGLTLIHIFVQGGIVGVLSFGAPLHYQLFRGAFFGLIAALNLLWLINTPILDEARIFFTKLLDDAQLQTGDLLFLSLAAGIGEELLFRGALQPFIGIWPTAILFVALHGYLNPLNLKMSLYGVLMVVVSAGLGYLFEYVGIYAAMTAHFLVDAILFIRFRYFASDEDLRKARELEDPF